MSIWKEDANEVFDRAARAYIRWVGTHRWVHLPLTGVMILEIALIWAFLGRGVGEFVLVMTFVPFLLGYLVLAIRLRRLKRRP